MPSPELPILSPAKAWLPTLAFLSVLLLGVLPSSTGADGSPDFCDSALDRADENRFGYRMRGDRCEGLYIRQLSSQALRVLSLTAQFENYNLEFTQDLVLAWRSPAAESIHLRAEALRPRVYYRMDTVRGDRETTYHWPSALLAALDITKDELGVVSWTRHNIGGRPRDLYLPLRITRSKPSPTKPAPSYELLIQPGRGLSEVFVSVASVGDDGRPARYLRDGKPLGLGYSPPGRPIVIAMDDLDQPGIYYVEIGAALDGGGTASRELWLYRAPN